MGWKLANTMETTHALEIVNKGILYGIPLIINSDQGSQFTGQEWIKLLNEHAIKISHTGKGRCIDNVRIERFWRTVKYEDIFLSHYGSVKEVRDGLYEFIEFYNNFRPHQALGYKTPAFFYNK